ncbi:hypothetical protein GCM10008940_18400 [Microbulbifer agarilyticus]
MSTQYAATFCLVMFGMIGNTNATFIGKNIYAPKIVQNVAVSVLYFLYKNTETIGQANTANVAMILGMEY